jgi:hypothetical protein
MSVAVQSREDVLAALKEFKERRGAEFHLTALGVFGSFARGEATADSDVDVVYETDDPNLFRTARMRMDLEEVLGRHVDVLRLRGGMNKRLMARVEREAKYV